LLEAEEEMASIFASKPKKCRLNTLILFSGEGNERPSENTLSFETNNFS
jgi:hypothetical protein